MELINGLERALSYIEAHLTEPIRAEDVAAQAYLSQFHFQRLFSALCGMPLGEYVRCRRLTLAAQELSRGSIRVIDAALKYGYDSPDSFARAFIRFHGVTPSQARERGVRLNAMAPLRITLSLEGGNIMEYRIVEKPAFTVVGAAETFHPDTSYAEIPKFWLRHMNSPLHEQIVGMYGVCLDEETDGTFTYLIADNYIPWQDVPEGCVAHTLPAGTWAVFPCRGKLPQALQQVNSRIWKEWLPSCTEYRLGGHYNVEMYAPPAENDDDCCNEIWIPLVRA